MRELFGKGYLWRHKGRGFRIFIREIHERPAGTVFLVGRIPDEGQSPYDRGFDDLLITKRPWTAEDLIREFEPLMTKIRPSAWERLMGDLDPLDE